MMILYGKTSELLTLDANVIIDKMGEDFKTVWSDYTDEYLTNAGLTLYEIVVFRLRCFAVAFDDKNRDKILKRFVEYDKSMSKYMRNSENINELSPHVIYIGEALSFYARGLIDGHRPVRQPIYQ